MIGDHRDFLSTKPTYSKLRSLTEEADLNLGQIQALWDETLAAYSHTSLTFSKDRLLAIAGVASAFSLGRRRTATYGVWVDCIFEELLWIYKDYRLERPRMELPLEQVPSWSWVKSNGNTIEKRFKFADSVYPATLISRPRRTGFGILSESNLEDRQLCIRGKLATCVCGSVRTGFGCNLKNRRIQEDRGI